MLVADAAVDLRGVARHDEAVSGSHRLHLCDNDVAGCRLHRRGRHFPYELNGSYAESNGGPSLGDHSGCGSWSHRGRWSSRPDLGQRWPSRLVAAAAEARLTFAAL